MKTYAASSEPESSVFRISIKLRHLRLRARLVAALGTLLHVSVATSASAQTWAASVSVTGTNDATTVANVLYQTPGPTLQVATAPANLGDLTLLWGGSPLAQASGVIIAAPYQMQYGYFFQLWLTTNGNYYIGSASHVSQ